MKAEDAARNMKVRCVRDVFTDDLEAPFKFKDMNLPVRGKVYTIRNKEKAPSDEVGVRLVEIVNKPVRFKLVGEKEIMFYPSRFAQV